MNHSLTRWFGAALALAFGLLAVARLPGADDPPPAEKKNQADNPARSAFRRESDARQFVRDFESFPAGVDLAKELKVTAEQADKLHVILGRLRQLSTDASAKHYEDAEKEITAVLTPQQLERMQQIRLQSRMRISGMAQTLAGDPTLRELGLTPEQMTKLKAAEDESQKQFEKDLEALRNKQREQQREILAAARKRVLELLTPPQREQYEKLVGSPIDVDERALDYGVGGVKRLSFGGRIGRVGFGPPASDIALPLAPQSKPVPPETKP